MRCRMLRPSKRVVVLVALFGCGHDAASAPAAPAPTAPAPAPAAPAAAAPVLEEGAHLPSRSVVLPGGPGLVRMDYIAFDGARHEVWIPAGNTGKVDLLDVGTEAIQSIDGFATGEMQRHGETRVVGPSSVAVSDAAVYVGDRADRQVCAFDPVTRARGACATLAS